jgi:hypothetical protein
MSKKETAKQVFIERAAEIEKQLAALKAHLANHEQRFAATENRDWGFPGSLGYVLEELREINSHFEN